MTPETKTSNDNSATLLTAKISRFESEHLNIQSRATVSSGPIYKLPLNSNVHVVINQDKQMLLLRLHRCKVRENTVSKQFLAS